MKKNRRLIFFVCFSLLCLGLAKKPPAGTVAVRKIDADLLKEKIADQKAYLLRMADPVHHAYFKKYDALTDTAETRLRTIYTASALFSLLKMDHFDPDPALEAQFKPMADFLLSMQVKEGALQGAFYYSYDPETDTKEERFVVGTASKTIFTLLELYRKTQDETYRRAAEEAGAWLLSRVDETGRVHPEIHLRKGKLKESRGNSYLYSGQVLSALSRLYGLTQDPKTLETAARVAGRLSEDARRTNYFVGDDFRKPNTVSTSWVIMSFIDFLRAQPDPSLETVLFRCLDQLLKHQILNPADLTNDGRFDDSTASSGNGWINEVMIEVYRFCASRGRKDCERYLTASQHIARWLVQNIYSDQNSSALANPARAKGGLKRNRREHSVRTDAVCHGANGLVGLLEIDPAIDFEIPEHVNPKGDRF